MKSFMKSRLPLLIAGLILSLPVTAHPGHGLDGVALHHLLPMLGFASTLSAVFLTGLFWSRRVRSSRRR